jgi:thioredoxin reductase
VTAASRGPESRPAKSRNAWLRALRASTVSAPRVSRNGTEWLANQVALDEDGYVLTGPALAPDLRDRDSWDRLGRGPFLVETSRPGVFAVGDVRSGSTKMVAPAVGEGGMAVRFAAEHLARSPQPRSMAALS